MTNETTPVLEAKKREALGSRAVELLRADGFVPGVLYGAGKDSENVTVSERDFEKLYKTAGESTIITLKLEGEDAPVLVQSLMRDPVKRFIQNIDFLGIDMTKTLKTSVPLEFIGEAPAVKEFGAMVVTNYTEIEIECLPTNLPSYIEVDLSSLVDANSQIRVSELKLPEGVTALTDQDAALAHSQMQKEEVIEETPADAEAAAVEAAGGEEGETQEGEGSGETPADGGEKKEEGDAGKKKS